MPILPISNPTCIVRNTGAVRGRTVAIEPGRTAVKHLRYGRIVLDSGDAALEGVVFISGKNAKTATKVKNDLIVLALIRVIH